MFLMLGNLLLLFTTFPYGNTIHQPYLERQFPLIIIWLDDKTDEKISYLRHKPLYRRVATHMVWEYEKKREN